MSRRNHPPEGQVPTTSESEYSGYLAAESDAWDGQNHALAGNSTGPLWDGTTPFWDFTTTADGTEVPSAWDCGLDESQYDIGTTGTGLDPSGHATFGFVGGPGMSS